ncbi:hypothetical protein NDU88_002076 [Pleurodeles waltl]|uniref:Uncharacterized protein n=1 Tax=Pleurodeles waltl TaxID=8319 RepID=A0AAV7SAL0_PLEWA|nr:hypothetical protein NDU88_002076 [Pleurodeles waltl]
MTNATEAHRHPVIYLRQLRLRRPSGSFIRTGVNIRAGSTSTPTVARTTLFCTSDIYTFGSLSHWKDAGQ